MDTSVLLKVAAGLPLSCIDAPVAVYGKIARSSSARKTWFPSVCIKRHISSISDQELLSASIARRAPFPFGLPNSGVFLVIADLNIRDL